MDSGLTLGEAIRAIRRRRGYSQRSLSDASSYAGQDGRMVPGISDTALLRIENGERANPHLATLLPVCEVLDIEIRLTPNGVQVIDLQEEAE